MGGSSSSRHAIEGCPLDRCNKRKDGSDLATSVAVAEAPYTRLHVMQRDGIHCRAPTSAWYVDVRRLLETTKPTVDGTDGGW